MSPLDIPVCRLACQQITTTEFERPEQLVSWLGALQAQDYAGAKWSIGLRLPGSTDIQIERAIAERKIVRSWPMRGTLHFVAAEDIRWMLALLTPRIIAGTKTRCKELELDEAIFARCRKLFVNVLQGNQILSRDEMYQFLEQAKISTTGQRGYHILWRMAQEGLICFGPNRGKQQTFVLLHEWIPEAKKVEQEQALATLAQRYFTSHGPATLQDFVWWSGLKITEARTGIESVASQLSCETFNGQTYWMSSDMPNLKKSAKALCLLSGFDEYLLGYKDRSAVLDAKHAQKICPGNNGMFSSTMVLNGQVVGTWRRTLKKKAIHFNFNSFQDINKIEPAVLKVSLERYGHFWGLPVVIEGN